MNLTLTLLLLAASLIAAAEIFRRFLRRHDKTRASFCNISEGQAQHGHKTYFTDTAVSQRWSIATFGTDRLHADTITSATAPILGVFSDENEDDPTLPVGVLVLGAFTGTGKVFLSSTVTHGQTLIPHPSGGAQALVSQGAGIIFGGTTLAGAVITGQAITTAGTGYTDGQVVQWQDATGTGAIGRLNVNGAGVPQSVTVQNGGIGYSAPVASLKPPGVLYSVLGVALQDGVSGDIIEFAPGGANQSASV